MTILINRIYSKTLTCLWCRTCLTSDNGRQMWIGTIGCFRCQPGIIQEIVGILYITPRIGFMSVSSNEYMRRCADKCIEVFILRSSCHDQSKIICSRIVIIIRESARINKVSTLASQCISTKIHQDRECFEFTWRKDVLSSITHLIDKVLCINTIQVNSWTACRILLEECFDTSFTQCISSIITGRKHETI